MKLLMSKAAESFHNSGSVQPNVCLLVLNLFLTDGSSCFETSVETSVTLSFVNKHTHIDVNTQIILLSVEY